jgi:hypothetical protein
LRMDWPFGPLALWLFDPLAHVRCLLLTNWLSNTRRPSPCTQRHDERTPAAPLVSARGP